MSLLRSSLAVTALVLLAAACLGGAGAKWAFGLAAAAFPVLLMALGAARGGRWSRGVVVTLAVLFVFLAGSILAILALPGRVMEAPWIGGVPLALGLQIVGIWLVPLLFVGIGYALSFDRHGLAPGDLERLRHSGRLDADPASDEDP
ncbi:MAG TPA: hypothetical protein VHQ65_15715 [Thermoanaerobaculia bacterium]|nr:hypothetical protein [Thermoanaerobaculia bacterium]